jgi:hypothetical protein
MKNPRKLFAYFVVFLFAVLSFVFAYYNGGFDTGRVFASLGNAFASAFLMFLIIDVFFDSGAELRERLKSLEELFGRSLDAFRNELASVSEVTKRLQSFEQVDIIGYALDRFMDNYASILIERIKRGAIVRVIIPSLDSEAGKMADLDSDGRVRTGVKKTLACIEFIQNQLGESYRGEIHYLQIDRPPHVSAIILDPHREDGLLRLVFYELTGPTAFGTDRLCLMITRLSHPEWFKYYTDQFNTLWLRRTDYVDAPMKRLSEQDFDDEDDEPEIEDDDGLLS